MSQLKYWNGTAEEFWMAVRNPLASQQPGEEQPSASIILAEILHLAQERAEQVHRARKMAAAGFRPRMTTFQLQLGVSEEEHEATSERHQRRCQQELLDSRYIPRRLREQDDP